MLSIIFEILINLFDAWLGVFFVLKLNNGKVKDNLSALLAIALSFTVSTAYLFISDFSALQSVIILAILLGFSFMMKSGSLLTRILGPVIFELVLIINSSLWTMFISQIFATSLSDLFSIFGLSRIILIVCCKITLTIILLLFIRLFSIKNTFRWIDLILYLVAPFMTVFVLYTFMLIGLRLDVTAFHGHIIISVLGLATINIFSLLIFIHSTQREQLKHDLDLLKQQTELEQKNYTELGNLYHQIRSMRHDFKEQLIVLKQLVADGEFNTVKKQIDKVEHSLKHSEDIIHTSNRMIDYIFNSKITSNPDITFIITGECVKLDRIDELDLASLFGNMLENAIEATKQSGGTMIEVKFSIQGDYQNIICKNPLKAPVIEVNPQLKTTKPEKDIHGYGVKSMKNIVKAAGGLIDFYEENSCFCVHIALPINDQIDLNA